MLGLKGFSLIVMIYNIPSNCTSPSDILTNMERMFLDKLEFDNVVNMFADSRNVNSIQDFAVGLKKVLILV